MRKKIEEYREILVAKHPEMKEQTMGASARAILIATLMQDLCQEDVETFKNHLRVMKDEKKDPLRREDLSVR